MQGLAGQLGDVQRWAERGAWLDAYLGNYLALVRRLLVLQTERVRPQADLVLAGSGALGPMVARAREHVLERLR